MAKRKPARLVTDVVRHEPTQEIDAAGQLLEVHRADVSVTDRTTRQTISFSSVVELRTTCQHWT